MLPKRQHATNEFELDRTPLFSFQRSKDNAVIVSGALTKLEAAERHY